MQGTGHRGQCFLQARVPSLPVLPSLDLSHKTPRLQQAALCARRRRPRGRRAGKPARWSRQGGTRGGVASSGRGRVSAPGPSRWACLQDSPRETRVGRSPVRGRLPRGVRVSAGPLPVRGHVAGSARGEEPDPWGAAGSEAAAAASGRPAGGRMGRPLRPGRAERSLAPHLGPATRGHAGHEGVTGPPKHFPGHHRHPL